jgi:hypothetical protein
MARFLNTRQLLLFPLILILSLNFLHGQLVEITTVIATPNKPAMFPRDPDFFMAQFEDCKYIIKPNGLITKHFQNLNDSVIFNIGVEKGYVIEYAELCHYNNHLIIIYTDTDYEAAGSTISSFNLKNYNKEWAFSGLGFNLNRLTINNGFIYLSSIGSVVKINLSNGKVAFKFSDLYERGKESFNSFTGVQFIGDTVTFLSRNYKTGTLDKVLVNDKTNELIEIIK